MWQVDIAFVARKKSSTIIPCHYAKFTLPNLGLDTTQVQSRIMRPLNRTRRAGANFTPVAHRQADRKAPVPLPYQSSEASLAQMQVPD